MIDCPPGKILNASTSRCVHTQGRVGKQVLGRMSEDRRVARARAAKKAKARAKGLRADDPRARIVRTARDYENGKFDSAGKFIKDQKGHAPQGWEPIIDHRGRQTWFADIPMPWGYYRATLAEVGIGLTVDRVVVTPTPSRKTVLTASFLGPALEAYRASAEDIAFWEPAFPEGVEDQSDYMKRTAKMAPFPKKPVATREATKWTRAGYKQVCDSMRGVAPGDRGTQSIIRALKAYMKHAALIAPTMPKMMTSPPGSKAPRPTALWRGVHGQDPPAVGSTVVSNGGCFTAFSHDKEVAQEFASRRFPSFLFRLQIDRIARGTPWIWMQADGFTGVNKNTVRSDIEEGEVLLPPGYFKVLSTKGAVVDVAFLPVPGYTRKGALPTPNGDGRVVTKTVKGDRLVLSHPNLAENVRVRRGHPEPRTKRKQAQSTIVRVKVPKLT